MEYIVDLNEKQVSIFLKGDIDIVNADDLQSEILQIFNANKLNIVFNCAELNFIDSTGLGVFFVLVNELQKTGHTITLTCLKKTIKKLFVITKLDEIICIED